MNNYAKRLKIFYSWKLNPRCFRYESDALTVMVLGLPGRGAEDKHIPKIFG